MKLTIENDRNEPFEKGKSLIVRRGEILKIELTKESTVKKLEIKLNLITNDGFHTTLLICGNTVKGWLLYGPSSEDSKVYYLQTSTIGIIGEYELSIKDEYPENMIPFLYLFNPYHPDDDVYMEDEIKRKAYLEDIYTTIYSGTHNQIGRKTWSVDQYTRTTLIVLRAILNGMPINKRSDPILLSRALSAIVNVQDDNGILVGKWSGGYSSGRNPMSWTGTKTILDKYLDKRRPVKYAQCWVYAGVLLTLLRAVGIPARIITNFGSHHDQNGTVHREVIVNEDFDVIESNTVDSVWNFHVWNEGWMIRRENNLFSGWQVLDATPQEPSNGIYCLGPTPKYAILNGLINEKYDVKFVFSEVNAKTLYILKKRNPTILKETFDEVGMLVCTQKIDSNIFENITDEYKYPKGSEEKKFVYNKMEMYLTYKTLKSVNILINAPTSVYVTRFFEGIIIIKDLVKKPTLKVTVHMMDNQGLRRVILMDNIVRISKEGAFNFKVNALRLVNNAYLFPVYKVTAMVTDLEDRVGYADLTSTIVFPPVEIEIPDKIECLKTFSLRIYYKNELGLKLTFVKFLIESITFKKKIKDVLPQIEINEEYTNNFNVIPKLVGKYVVSVTMSSKEMCAVNNQIWIVVE